MNNELPEKNNQATFAQKFNSMFESRSSKSKLFFGALVTAMIISWFLYARGNGVESALSDLLPLIIFFPWALYESNSSPGAINWLLYIGIMVVGIASKNSKLSRALFLVFVLLLILNIRGCATIAG